MPPYELPDKAIEFSPNHWYQWFEFDPEHHPKAPKKAGIIEWHLDPETGKLCGGAVHFWRPEGEPGNTWQVISLDPLHLEPSIHCVKEKHGCGMHGWIRDGQWVQA